MRVKVSRNRQSTATDELAIFIDHSSYLFWWSVKFDLTRLNNLSHVTNCIRIITHYFCTCRIILYYLFRSSVYWNLNKLFLFRFSSFSINADVVCACTYNSRSILTIIIIIIISWTALNFQMFESWKFKRLKIELIPNLR